MEIHAILLMIEEKEANHLDFIDQVFECDNEGTVKIFYDFEAAKRYQEDQGIDGRVIPLSIY